METALNLELRACFSFYKIMWRYGTQSGHLSVAEIVQVKLKLGREGF